MLSMFNFKPMQLMDRQKGRLDRSSPLPPDAQPEPTAQTGGAQIAEWQTLILSALEKLRGLAGTSENEFLQIGEQMQEVYQQSLEISQIANQLIETASGDSLRMLSNRLQLMASEMGSFLVKFQSRSRESFSTLNHTKKLLDQFDAHLENVKTMARPLYMLEVLIKVQSARLGEIGEGFVLLALDINKLSEQITAKLDAIKAHQASVFTLITKNLQVIEQLSTVEEEDAQSTLKSILSSLQELDSANERFTQLGNTIATIVKVISSNIGQVVSSLQFHDINRQQLEHIIESLERLLSEISSSQGTDQDDAARQTVIMAVGDVCELQEAQLQFASAELYTAVSTIIASLRDVASQQATIQQETTAASGLMDESGTSFVDAISEGLSTSTALLTSCSSRHHEVSKTMEEMASAIGASASFVNEIDGVGDNIVITALNAQIKAGQVGRQGGALAVLAEEIRRLSSGASQNTGAISAILHEIDSTTTTLIQENGSDESKLSTWLMSVEKEIHEIMALLGELNKQLRSLVRTIQAKIASLAKNVEQITAGIDIHEQSRSVAEEVIAALHQIVTQSRDLVPASSEFKASLIEMNEHYTMESERRVHLAIASRHGGEIEPVAQGQEPGPPADESEFGDNVDLF